MNRLLAGFAASICLALPLLAGCGAGSGAAGFQPGSILYVDASNGGPATGSKSLPFPTIEQALAVATSGETVSIAAGTYTPPNGVLVLKPGVALIGAGAASTIIQGDVQDSSSSLLPIGLQGLTFGRFTFGRGSITGTPSGANAVKSCACKSISIMYGQASSATSPSYEFTIDSNTVTEQIKLAHGMGAAVNAVTKNTVTGDILLSMADGATNSVTGNKVTGTITDSSGVCTTAISGNTVVGSILDTSGGYKDGREDEIIANNTVTLDAPAHAIGQRPAAISSKGASVTIRSNTVTCTGDVDGIIAASGAPTNITGNTVTVPTPTGVFVTNFPCALNTSSGTGTVQGNILHGGYIGILDQSAGTFTGNTVNKSQIGVQTSGTGAYTSNTITACAGDGLAVLGAPGPFTGNVITKNGAAGVRIRLAKLNTTGATVVDFGGGPLSGAGGNTLQGNAAFDMVVWSAASLVPTIFAQNNTWSHSTAALIAADDVSDGVDNSAYSTVVFVPFK